MVLPSPDIGGMGGSDQEIAAGRQQEAEQFERFEVAYQGVENLNSPERVLDKDRLRVFVREHVLGDILMAFESAKRQNQFVVERLQEGLYRAAARMRRLLPLGDVSPTVEEIRAGLVAYKGTLKEALSDDDQLILKEATPTLDADEVDRLRASGELPISFKVEEEITVRRRGVPVPIPVEVWYFAGRREGILDKERGRPVLITEIEVDGQDAREKRLKLATEQDRSRKEVSAYANLLAKREEQHVFRWNETAYAEQMFKRFGKIIMLARHYKEILRSPETRPEFARFGRKIEIAYEALDDITEGRAVVEMMDPATGEMKPYILPNIFAYGQNKTLEELALYYMRERVSAEAPMRDDIVPGENPDLDAANEFDNYAASVVALFFADHWDLDSEKAFDLDYSPEGRINEIRQYAVGFGDFAKVQWVGLRRRKERFGDPLGQVGRAGLLASGKEKRPYRRAAGAPMTIGVLPQGPGNFLRALPLDVVATNKKTGKKKKIIIYGDQLAYGTHYHGEPTPAQANRSPKSAKRNVWFDGGRYWSEVRKANDSGKVRDEDVWVYEVVGLANLPWDEIQLLFGDAGTMFGLSIHDINQIQVLHVDSEADPLQALQARIVDTNRTIKGDIKRNRGQGGLGAEHLNIALGTNTHAFEVPYRLASYYFYKAFYAEFIRTDYFKQWEEYVKTDSLEKLNKAVEVALIFISNYNELSKDTAAKFERYLRVSLIAGLVTATLRRDETAPVGNIAESRQQVYIGKSTQEREELVNTALTQGFLLAKEGENKDVTWRYEEDQKLFRRIVRERESGKPLTPFDGRLDRFFTKRQQTELRRLYKFT